MASWEMSMPFEYDILSLIQGLVSCEIWQIGECI